MYRIDGNQDQRCDVSQLGEGIQIPIRKMNSEDVCIPFHLCSFREDLGEALLAAWLVESHKIQETLFTFRKSVQICKPFPCHDCENTQA